MSRTRRELAAFKRRGEKMFREAVVVVRRVSWPPLFGERIFADRPILFDREGEPLDWDEWGMLHSFRSYCYVAGTPVGDLYVATDWIGHDLGLGLSGWALRTWPVGVDGPPVIFETMIFGDENQADLHPELRVFVGAVVRYSTAAEAEAGHDAICMEIRQLMAKIEMAEQVHAEALP